MSHRWPGWLALSRYAATLCFHKLCILLCGLYLRFQLRRTRLAKQVSLWRLIWHDASKFSAAEFVAYARHFFGGPLVAGEDDGFDDAFHHHARHNDHHVEHWWNSPDWRLSDCAKEDSRVNAGVHARRMPDEAVVEMLVDWFAAEVSYKGRMPVPGHATSKEQRHRWRWAESRALSTGLHPHSEAIFLALLFHVGFGAEIGGEEVVRKAAEGKLREGVVPLSAADRTRVEELIASSPYR